MGGLYSRKATVEQCLALSSGVLQRRGAIIAGGRRAGFITWPGRWGGAAEAALAFDADATNPAHALLRVEYRCVEVDPKGRPIATEDVALEVALDATPLPWGGLLVVPLPCGLRPPLRQALPAPRRPGFRLPGVPRPDLSVGARGPQI